MGALKQAGTMVYEPIHRFRLEIPADTFGATVSVLARLHAVPQTQEMLGPSCTLEDEVPALTRGEGSLLECAFDRYEAVRGAIPTRPRSDHNPLNRKEYLLHVARRV